MTITSTTRAQGGSIVTSIPAEVVRQFGLEPGDPIYWIEDTAGSFRVTPFNSETQAALKAHAGIMAEYKDVFKALAE